MIKMTTSTETTKSVKRISPTFVDEVSNCFTWAKPKNKKDQLEVVKGYYSQEVESEEMDETLKGLINKWKESTINRAMYSLFSDALHEKLWEIQYEDDMTKEQKAQAYQKVFDEFVSEYKSSVITKADGSIHLVIKGDNMTQTKEPQTNYMTKALERISNISDKETEAKIDEVISGLEKSLSETEPDTSEDIVSVEEVKKTETQDNQGEKELEELKKAQEQNEALLAQVEELKKAQEQSAALASELEELKKAQEQTKIELEKSELMKSVESEYSMLSGKPEEIVEMVYSIKKSDLSDEAKAYVFSNFKSLSKANQEQTEEIGNAQNSESAELTKGQIYDNKVQSLMKSNGITKLQAIAQLNGSKEHLEAITNK